MTDPILQPTQPVETPIAAEDTSAGKRRAADRLNIPSSVVRSAGFVPGDSVHVSDQDPAGGASKPALVLLKEQPTNRLGTYRVAGDSRIRVTPAMLKKCGMEGETFDFDSSAGKIVVRLR
jgi:hypothetical protein